MQTVEILPYGALTQEQKDAFPDIFIDGFGHLMNFTKSRAEQQTLFSDVYSDELFFAYVEDGAVLGILGIANNKERPVHVKKEPFVTLYGKKGELIYQQINDIFQSKVVRNDKEMYIDVLATDKNARGRGVATKLLQYAFAMDGYQEYTIEVFSRNKAARSLYKKIGFQEIKKKWYSPIITLGYGYPILMKMQ
ncbi:MAG: GNAT family N-acetyltransferase [Eubacteriales bacterium]|nr:GNAT family N-acetyltransferase [Eubacteriales bacterium]